MKKLEDIPKKEIFEVPDGYFDKLPGIIQSRIAKEQKPAFAWAQFSLRYALPSVLILAVAIFWFTRIEPVQDAESLLADIDTEQLLAYLDDSDLSTDEILDHAGLNEDDADDIESEVYGLPIIEDEIDQLLEEQFTEQPVSGDTTL